MAMKRIITFQCEDKTLTPYQTGDRILKTLDSLLTRNGYHLLPDDRYDPDWSLLVQNEKCEFAVVLVCQSLSPSYWNISLEDLKYQLLDDIELQEQINPILYEVVSNLSNVSNIIWYDDFTFLKLKGS